MNSLAKYDVYRIVTDYEALIEALRDRVFDLNISCEEVEEIGGLSPRYVTKILADPPIKNLGIKGFSGLLKATGLSMVMVVDNDRFAALETTLKQRKIVGASAIQIREKIAKQASHPQLASAVSISDRMRALGQLTPREARVKGGKRRLKTMSQRARQRAATHAARTRWAKNRSTK